MLQEFSFPKDVLEQVQENAKPKALRKMLVIYAEVSVSDLVRLLSNQVFAVANQVSQQGFAVGMKQVLTDYLEYLVKARIYQVHELRMGTKPKAVQYPDFFGPVLASIGKYEDPVKNLVILPVLKDDPMLVKDSNGMIIGINDKAFLQSFDKEKYYDLLSMANIAGIRFSRALPFDLYVKTDDIFKISVEGDEVYGSDSKVPSYGGLLSRLFLTINYLERIYGEARVFYTLVSTMEEIVVRMSKRFCNPSLLKSNAEA